MGPWTVHILVCQGLYLTSIDLEWTRTVPGSLSIGLGGAQVYKYDPRYRSGSPEDWKSSICADEQYLAGVFRIYFSKKMPPASIAHVITCENRRFILQKDQVSASRHSITYQLFSFSFGVEEHRGTCLEYWKVYCRLPSHLSYPLKKLRIFSFSFF